MNEERRDLPQSLPLARLLEESFRIVEVAILAYIVAIAILAIAEIAARQQFLSFLSTRIEMIKAEIVDLTRTSATGNPSSQDDTAYVNHLRKKVQALQRVKADADSLIAIGAEQPSQTLAALRRREAEMGSFSEPEPRELLRTAQSVVHRSLSIMGLDVERLSADHLLALAVITCGAIGALIGSIRSQRRLTFRYLSLGFASGRHLLSD